MANFFTPQTGQSIQRFGSALSGKLPAFDKLAAVQQQGLDEERRAALLADNRGVRRFLEAGNNDQAIALLRNRVADITRLGGDPTDTQGLLTQLEGGDFAGALSEVTQLDNFGIDSGFLPPFPEVAADRFISVQDGKALFQTAQGNVEARDIEGFSQSDFGSTKLVQSAKILPGGVVQIVFKDGTIETKTATPEELAAIIDAENRGVSLAVAKATQKAAGTVVAKGEAGREQDTIQLGVDAVQGIPILRRSLQLLERIETGGIDAARLRAKQLFGVEGADEGELSANLGRAVLSRLRETFGAAFTEREGARLERMSAGFGKSPATNRRILRQSLKIADNAAQRALEAARRTGDTASESQLLDFIDGRFDLTDEGLAGIFTPAAEMTDQQLLEALGAQ